MIHAYDWFAGRRLIGQYAQSFDAVEAFCLDRQGLEPRIDKMLTNLLSVSFRMWRGSWVFEAQEHLDEMIPLLQAALVYAYRTNSICSGKFSELQTYPELQKSIPESIRWMLGDGTLSAYDRFSPQLAAAMAGANIDTSSMDLFRIRQLDKELGGTTDPHCVTPAAAFCLAHRLSTAGGGGISLGEALVRVRQFAVDAEVKGFSPHQQLEACLQLSRQRMNTSEPSRFTAATAFELAQQLVSHGISVKDATAVMQLADEQGCSLDEAIAALAS